MDYQITCITKPNRLSTYDRILAVGGPGFRLSVDDVITHIRNGHTFWTYVHGRRAEIRVVSDSNGAYIQTTADSILFNNLLSLPECP